MVLKEKSGRRLAKTSLRLLVSRACHLLVLAAISAIVICYGSLLHSHLGAPSVLWLVARQCAAFRLEHRLDGYAAWRTLYAQILRASVVQKMDSATFHHA